MKSQRGKTGEKHRARPPKSAKKATWMRSGVAHLQSMIELTQIQPISTPVTGDTGFELLSSYNWAPMSIPTIYVPGGPPKWDPPHLPLALPQDSGIRYVDQNAFKTPAYSFEPLFQAMSITKPGYDFGGVDLVVNRNSLRKLLGIAAGRVGESFRIDLHMVHNTLFVTRKEQRNRETISPSHFVGYGHNFEKAFTSPEEGLEDSASHHRIVRYALGDLSCVVRFEVDASCELTDHPWSWEKAPQIETKLLDVDIPGNPSQQSLDRSTPEANSADELLSSLASFSFNPPKQTNTDYIATRVIQRGRVKSSSAMAEIKTRVRNHHLRDHLPQLWFGRTPHLFIGKHTDGTFDKLIEIDAATCFSEWESRNQVSLQKMVGLIGELRKAASSAGDGGCIAIYESKERPPKLGIYAPSFKKHVLPLDFVVKHWTGRCTENDGKQ